MYRVTSRYAKALLQLAIERGLLELIRKDMHCFKLLCVASKLLCSTLKDPMVKHTEKAAILRAIFHENVHALTLSFFTMVAKKRRASLLPSIIHAFLIHYDQHYGIKSARATTPFPLSEDLLLQLKKMAQRVAGCQQIKLEQKIDSSLLGGYVLQVDGTRIDQSLCKKLRLLKHNFMTKTH